MSDVTPQPPDSTGPTIKSKGHGITKRFGALPIWAWILIFAALVGIFYWYKKKAAATKAANVPLTGDQLTPGTTANNQLSPDGGSVSATDTTGATTGSSTTNAQWGLNASNVLVGQGNDPTVVSNAISAYLDGQSLTPAQQLLINSAIQQCGEPPQGVLPVATSTTGVPYTVVSGDSLVSIAQQFYGDPSQWKNIYAANVAVIGADPLALHHGEVLQLPGQGLLATPGPAYQTTGVPQSNLYTVQYGDTLIQLAERFYGNTNWQPIYTANKGSIPNQNELQPGVVLTIPAG